jgi:hypothetical protein
MLKFLTSLSFLYAISIIVLLVYGFLYYRDFERTRFRRRFPLVFLIISVACFSFLWINMHAPLSLKTFSNLDHHFISHDGFEVNKKIELGRTDTLNYDNNSFNRFEIERKNGQAGISSIYSEEPFYLEGELGYKILSVNYPAFGHVLSLRCDKVEISIACRPDDLFELKIGGNVYSRELFIKKAINCWNLFREEDRFINSADFNNEKLVAALKNILLLRDDVSRKKGGELKYFLSGKLFKNAESVSYDESKVKLNDQRFEAPLPDQSNFAWGIGFLENNRNQFHVLYGGGDSFSLINRYPLSYPLTEENRNDWSKHKVNKFLLSDSRDMMNIPAVFKEGFLFSPLSDDNATSFSPVLLTYQKTANNDSLKLNAQRLDNLQKRIPIRREKLILPSKSAGFSWVFSIRNTYDWNFDIGLFSDKAWQGMLFGSLGLFFLLIFLSSLVRPVESQSWVWQLVSCITMILLTTRFLLYWRYKSFPPYEGLDLPSQQQLLSFSNFGIILFATIILALILGFPVIKYGYQLILKGFVNTIGKPWRTGSNTFKEGFLNSRTNKAVLIQLLDKKLWFFVTWLLLLVITGSIAAAGNFDPGVCRHLAIAAVLFYFIFLFLSYRHSPLVVSEKESWWQIDTHQMFQLIVSNPVKILLSTSLLALLVFIDIGFAIVFLNFQRGFFMH